ncbi:MAG TPA: GlsB/YeaQ/YmgE family stress response membrane protein, partial [Bacilli bacterium]
MDLIFLWIVFGGFTGWIASIITKNDKRMGILANIIVGLLGTFLGVWIASLIGIGSFRTFSLGGFLIALFGSVVLLTIINLI